MSGIVLSASVRQNLLSLQSTADLLATTQNRLATGKKVNTALDNPTNFFTASSLDARASDINNLLDGISNGVQVLQAANTGISSLQKLIDSAKSVANQALQASVGYSTKSNFSTTISGATSDNLLGAASFADAAAAAGSAINDNHTLTPTNNTVEGSQVLTNNILGLQDTTFTGSAVAPTRTTAATLGSTVNISGALSTAGFAAGDSFNITIGSTTKTFTFYDSAAGGSAPGGGQVGIDLNGTTATGATLVSAINGASGFNAVVSALNGSNGLQLTATNLTDSITVADNASSAASTFSFGGFSSGSVTANATTTTPTATGATLLSGTTNNAAGALNLSGKSITVNGKTINITGTGAANVTFLNGGTIGADQTVANLVSAINTVAGSTVAAINGSGQITLTAHAADTTDFSIADVSTGNALSQLGLATGSGQTRNVVRQDGGASHPPITAFSALASSASTTSSGLASAITAGTSITVNGQTLNFVNGGGTSTTASGGQIDIATANVGDVLTAIDKITGTYGTANASTVTAGKIKLGTGTASSLVLSDSSGVSGTVLAKLGLAPGTTLRTVPPATTPITGLTGLSGTAGPSSNALPTAFTNADTIVVNGKTITFSSSSATSTSANGGVVNTASGSVQDVVDAIDKITGTYGTANASTISGGAITLHTGTAANLTTSGTGLAKLGLTAGTTARTATGSLDGKTLTIGSTGNGVATSLTFGTGNGQVKSLADLNTALASNNLLATLDGSGKLTIQTTNDAASSTIGTIGGTSTVSGQVFAGATATGPVQDQAALLNRSNLVSQYNNILDQITRTAQDSSFNGIDLLNGDQLKLTFNETGSSTLKIQGVTFDYSGLGLSKLGAGTDFLDNSSVNNALTKLASASSTLRTQASALGSNLSIVQIRQDFSKNLINVLQTGSSNLTLADTNEEAANSQALSTRQSIAVSALALANQSQQSVLQLLR